MPRKHRAARERTGPPLEDNRPRRASSQLAAPGLDVRAVTGDKIYRCPGCDHEIRPKVAHLVVIPDDAPDERRHWHTNCWEQELRRRRGRR
jgi:hypothetical protein